MHVHACLEGSFSISPQVEGCTNRLDMSNNLTKTLLMCPTHKSAKCLRMRLTQGTHWDLRACYKCYAVKPTGEFEGYLGYVVLDLG